MTPIRAFAAVVAATTILLPGVADAAPAQTGTVRIELRVDERAENWGAVFGPGGSDCAPEDPLDPLTQVVTCSGAPASGSIQIEVFSGFVVSGACGDADPDADSERGLAVLRAG